MRIVVTGGAGYIGSVLVPRLLAAGHEVHVVDSLVYGGHGLLPYFIEPGFSLSRVDVRDRAALGPELDGADAVVHFAALVGYPLCKKLPVEAREVNVTGSYNVVDLAPPGARLVFASTGSNYGEVVGVCSEQTALNPLSQYGRTKVEAEAYFLDRPSAVSLRFATAFGLSPRLRLDLMVNDFVWQAIHQRFLVVYERHFRRTFIHVTDIARAVLYALEQPLEYRVYNVGHESLNFTKAEIVSLLQRRLDFQVHFAEVGADEDRRDYAVDYTRIRAAGFRVEVDIERGLDELIEGLRLVEVAHPSGRV